MKQLPGYSLVRTIGMGGMTDLHVSRNPQGKNVVVRFLRADLLKDRISKKRFQRGASILAKLDHRNIVKIIEEGKLKGTPYMVLEYIEGKNLRELLVQQPEILTNHPLQILKQLASAVAYTHAQGMLHLDLKPENVMLNSDLHLVLIDFDLALPHKGKSQKLKTLPGTPTYLAPETLNSGQVDQQSEIYSFGLVAYELLTGYKPYSANSPKEYEKHLRSVNIEAIPMTRYRNNLPEAMVNIIHKCLAKKPAGRYPSMAFVQRDLMKLA